VCAEAQYFMLHNTTHLALNAPMNPRVGAATWSCGRLLIYGGCRDRGTSVGSHNKLQSTVWCMASVTRVMIRITLPVELLCGILSHALQACFSDGAWELIYVSQHLMVLGT
jgi:hypothetical protein